MALAAYLAKNYLNASGASSDPSDLSARPKKRRKKDKSRAEETSLIIADDDELSLRNSSVAGGEDDPDRPLFDTNTRSAEFRKSKKNNWMSLTSSTTPTPDADQAAADRILAAAAADLDKSREGVNQEDAPAIVATEHDKDVPQMSSGIRAGLQTAADTAALEAAEAQRKEAERRALKSQRRTKVHDELEEETVYRDATGRRIDVSMKRAEARAAELARLKAEKAEKESAMGDVQRQAKAERKAELEEAKFMPVARGEDDEDMNDELRGRVRWDDPMAGYMAQKQAEEAPARVKGHGQEQGFVKVRRKEYPGAAPPNRYGIKPGWRWDGVDRGNGFEKEWFQARGRKARNENLEYQWQMDE